jgi:hypothetical protein
MKIAAVLLAALTLGLAACGGSSEPTTSATTPATTATTAPAGTDTTGDTGGGEQYPAAARNSFLDSCEASATAEQCECALSYLEENVTLDEFIQAGLDISQGKEAPEAITKATESCA